jgi:hypothetical protein
MADNEAAEETFVYIRLSGDSTSKPGLSSRAAFDQTWKAKGWVIVDDDEAAQLGVPETSPAPNKKKG